CGRLTRCRIILSSGELDCSPLFCFPRFVPDSAGYSDKKRKAAIVRLYQNMLV
ncbi:hypothetical protein HMPREF3204_00011, partial [Gardnerella pickettii]